MITSKFKVVIIVEFQTCCRVADSIVEMTNEDILSHLISYCQRYLV